MVLDDLGWTIYRIWLPDWASNREREIQKINEKVESLVAGDTDASESDGKAFSYEAEVESSNVAASEVNGTVRSVVTSNSGSRITWRLSRAQSVTTTF